MPQISLQVESTCPLSSGQSSVLWPAAAAWRHGQCSGITQCSQEALPWSKQAWQWPIASWKCSLLQFSTTLDKPLQDTLLLHLPQALLRPAVLSAPASGLGAKEVRTALMRVLSIPVAQSSLCQQQLAPLTVVGAGLDTPQVLLLACPWEPPRAGQMPEPPPPQGCLPVPGARPSGASLHSNGMESWCLGSSPSGLCALSYLPSFLLPCELSHNC
jgi:hypothetical protein